MADEPNNDVVYAAGLHKSYGSVEAVRGIDFQVPAGEFFGLLGPNGAGKSTTMRMISSVSQPTQGVLRVLGMDPVTQGPQIRVRLGVVPQEDNLEGELSAAETIYTYGRFFGIKKAVLKPRVKELLEFAQLADRAETPMREFSGGMKRRLIIARSLINEPDLLLLDEPTTGLDPQARHILWDRLYRLKERGKTMVLTTHFMDEAEQLCDRLVVIDEGKIKAEGSPRELIRRYATKEVLELRYPSGNIEDHVRPIRNAIGEKDVKIEQLPDRVLLYAEDGEALLAHLSSYEITAASTLVRRSSLEDVFLILTGRSLVD